MDEKTKETLTGILKSQVDNAAILSNILAQIEGLKQDYIKRISSITSTDKKIINSEIEMQIIIARDLIENLSKTK